MAIRVRNNLISVIMGKRGTGKSYYTVNSLLPAYQKAHPNKRIIVFMRVNHWMYKDMPPIKLDMLPRWRQQSGMYKICETDTKKVFEYIDKYVRNSLVVIEDATTYFINGQITEEIKNAIIDAKQKNNDLIFQFHGFMSIPPQIIEMIDIYTMFKCISPDRRKNLLELIDHYDHIKPAWLSVMADPNPYAKRIVKI
jgi:ABC-type lipoprotein export system ATPase subunit